MAFTAVSSILTAGLVKIGYKFAEKKKWLPKSIYHRLSLKKIREGDLKQALYFNSVAIKKNPEYENALIVRDIISMQNDAKSDRIKEMIRSEEDHIQALISLKNENKKKLKEQLDRNKMLKVIFIFLLLVVIGCSYYGIFYLRNVEYKYMVLTVVLILAGLTVYFLINRFLGDRKKIKETIARQERLVSIETYSREIKVRQKRLDILKNQLADI